ncbi:MAG: hypothetical protein V1709_08215 [Planctomycetota bacterium]
MICIVRIQAQEKPELLWNNMLDNKDRLQDVLGNKGKILYLSKRRKYNEISLFVHIADSNILGDFIAEHLSKLEMVTGIWLINMLKPIFYPLPENALQMKRYTVTLKAYSSKLNEIYNALTILKPSEDVKMSYLAYTCHLFGDCIQVSLQAIEGVDIQKYVNEAINRIPGVLRSTIYEIEKTYPFISYEEWQRYTSQNTVLMEWDEKNMVEQFRK